MKKCECPYSGRRQRHYEWCERRASNRRAARPMQRFEVRQRATIEYVWVIEAQTARQAIDFANDLGQYHATEQYTSESQPRAKVLDADAR